MMMQYPHDLFNISGKNHFSIEHYKSPYNIWNTYDYKINMYALILTLNKFKFSKHTDHVKTDTRAIRIQR